MRAGLLAQVIATAKLAAHSHHFLVSQRQDVTRYDNDWHFFAGNHLMPGFHRFDQSMIWIKAKADCSVLFSLVLSWQPIATAPFDRDLELAVFGKAGSHAVAFPFPCRRMLRGWLNAETKEPIEIRPTHWREWRQSN